MPVSAKLQSAGLTDPGRKRTNNEDRFYVDAERGMFIVADGMGGEAAGETAAEIAVNIMRARLERDAGTPAEKMREAIALANNEIYEAAQRNAAWTGMACVLTAALVGEDRVTIGHVGDSRLYLLGPGSAIRKITPDHSPVGEREDAGELSERDAMLHPRRNEVFRDVGSAQHRPDDPGFIEILTIPFQQDQAILICSDGLSDLVTADEIRRNVEANAANPRAAVQALINAANRAGGKDNVTAVLVEGPKYAPPRAVSAPVEESEVGEERRSGLRPWMWIAAGLFLGLLLGIGIARRSASPVVDKPVPQPPAAGRTWSVGPAETADAATISAALEKAAAGDHIVVAPGQYSEQVKLKSGVDVSSVQPGAAVIGSELGDGVVVADGVQSARMSGFKIASKVLSVGIEIRNSSVRLDDMDIVNATIAGIEARGASDVNVLASRITGKPAAAIAGYDTARIRVVHSMLARSGVKLHDQASATQSNNVVSR